MNRPERGRGGGAEHVGRGGAAALAAMALWLAWLPSCAPKSAVQGIRAVTTSNIVADWVRQVGGDRVSVFALLQPGSDPHTFQPGAADVARIPGADLVFTVGLGLEGAWLNTLLQNTAADPARVVTLGTNVDPLPASGETTADGATQAGGPFDPHFWWDPLRVKLAINEIAARLSRADPEGETLYLSNRDAYLLELDRLDASTVESVRLIPASARMLVTSHNTMRYFAARYDFEAVGSVFPGLSTDREPSAAELAALADTVRRLNVRAIFTETIVSDRLAQAIATETGARVVRLYSDSLGAGGSGADTYLSMMARDVQTIISALGK